MACGTSNYQIFGRLQIAVSHNRGLWRHRLKPQAEIGIKLCATNCQSCQSYHSTNVEVQISACFISVKRVVFIKILYLIIMLFYHDYMGSITTAQQKLIIIISYDNFLIKFNTTRFRLIKQIMQWETMLCVKWYYIMHVPCFMYSVMQVY